MAVARAEGMEIDLAVEPEITAFAVAGAASEVAKTIHQHSSPLIRGGVEGGGQMGAVVLNK